MMPHGDSGRAANAVTVNLPEVGYYHYGKPVFSSTLFEVAAQVGKQRMELWLPDQDVTGDFTIDAAEARSLAAALLAAADASEVQG